MKLTTFPMQIKKKFTTFFHIVFILLVIIGIGLMYSNTNFGRGLSWLKTESFEDTDTFNDLLQTDIEHIFDYVNFKDVFETSGELDYNKQMVSVSQRSNPTFSGSSEKIYTLDELIRYAKTKGYYLNEQYQVVRDQMDEAFDDESDLVINWKAYRPTERVTEPGQALASLEKISYEVLNYLSAYYTARINLVENPSNLYFTVCYQRNADDQSIYTNAGEKTIDELKALGKYSYLSGSSIIMETNLSTPPSNMTTTAEACNPYGNNNYYMIVAIDTSYPADDAYAAESATFHHMRLLQVIGLISLVTGLVGSLLTLVYLAGISGHKSNKSQDITLHYFDTISTEGSLIVTAAAIFLGLFISDKVGERLLHLLVNREYWYYAERLLRSVIVYGVGMVETFSLIRRYKAQTLLSNSLIGSFRRTVSVCFTKKRFTFRLTLSFIAYLACNLLIVGSAFYLLFTWDGVTRFIVFIVLGIVFCLLNIWVYLQLYKDAWQSDKISEAVSNIAAGDTSYKIDTAEFSGKEKNLADSINNISSGLETALRQQVKSERLKADLITNVSHDIKTPLTSIISYVDLIKRENIQNEKVQDYLEVLDQKSQRLKNLTEDLVEASKASSGNLKLEISRIDFVELIQQTNGEFEEKFSSRRLETVTNLPEQCIIIEADGRHLWRVLENIYNNAFKYAMEGSRIYIDMWTTGQLVSFTIKNVSANPLNIKANELTERFVRGDVARTTEGSGLGLSIAKSLTELQHGKFDIYIDGDLFKIQVSFPVSQIL